MGLRKNVQPRHGSDVLGPGCTPRRALPATPAPWRRPLVALVLAGGIGALGLNAAPATAAEPAPNHSRTQSSERSCERQAPRRAATKQKQQSDQQRSTNRTKQSERTSGGERTSGSSAPRRAASDASTTARTSKVTTTAADAGTTVTTSNTRSNGASAPLAKGSYRVSAKFGATGNWSRYHTGQDFSAPSGTAVRAVVSGTVVSGNVGSWAGKYVAIRAADGSSTLYAHLSSTDVKVGQQVTAGQKIGEVGSTGRSFGSHLHFEYYPSGRTPGDVYSATNPMTYLSSLGITM